MFYYNAKLKMQCVVKKRMVIEGVTILEIYAVS